MYFNSRTSSKICTGLHLCLWNEEGVKAVLISREDLVYGVKKYPGNGRPLVVRVSPDQLVSLIRK